MSCVGHCSGKGVHSHEVLESSLISNEERGDTQKMIELVCRIALAAIGAVAVFYTQSDALVAAILGFFVSSGTIELIGGVSLACVGVAGVVNALATGSLVSLAIGIVAGSLGRYLIEQHDDAPLGFAEPTIQYIGREGAKLFV